MDCFGQTMYSDIITRFYHSLQPLQTLDQNPFYTEEEMRDYEQQLANEEKDINHRSTELQRQREELEKKQQELNAQRVELKQVSSVTLCCCL